jgi:multiple sugar transport system substrate-binding protein
MSTKKFKKEEEFGRELSKRGYSRRQILRLGAMLGMGGAALAACAPPAAAPKAAEAPAAAPTEKPAEAAPVVSLFDAAEGADAAWPKSSVADPAAKVTLSVAHAWDATFFERQKQFDALFMKRHPNIEIKGENTAWGDLRQKYLTLAAGGALPDISYIHFSWAQQMIKAGLLKSLDDYIAAEKDFKLEDFFPASLPSYKRDGKLWVVPYDEGPMILYYNKDLFDRLAWLTPATPGRWMT